MQMTLRFCIALLIAKLTICSVAADDGILDDNLDCPMPPDSGIIQGWQSYRVGKYGFAVTAVGSSEWMQGVPGSKPDFRPDLRADELAARIVCGGHRAGSHAFGVENFYQNNDLIFVGDGFRHIIEMKPDKDPTRGDVVLSQTTENPEGVPECKGLIVTPKGHFNAWVAGGFLREIRPKGDSKVEFEAVIDFWDLLVHPIGYYKPDRVLVLKTGDEFTVTYPVRGARQFINGTATGIVRCVGVYPAIPDKKFRGGVGLIPISHTFKANRVFATP